MKRETMYMEARAPDDFVFMSLYDEDINVLPRDALPEKEGNGNMRCSWTILLRKTCSVQSYTEIDTGARMHISNHFALCADYE